MALLPFLVAGLGQGAVYALSGLGVVVLYRAAGVVNFAFGALAALGAMTAWQLIQTGWSPLLGWSASIVVATACSVAYGITVAPRLSHRDPSVRAIGTLGFALVVLGLVNFWWGEIPRRFELPSDRLYLVIAGVRVTYTRLYALLAAVLATASISVLMVATPVGLWMRALADSRQVSVLSGVPVFLADTTAWAISGILAGISGIFLANLVRLQPSFLTFLVIPAVATALFGGLKSLPRTLLAGLLLGVSEAGLAVNTNIAPFRTALPYVVALLFIAGSQVLGRGTRAHE
ncbi:branched-chain amino acid ABC transporter permease [Bradyrhizobium sp. PRIMUS42]|uniref:branched-chain amino acid ABC transporter permease n=1 Tax=Bradyrhizobium sp. PRIMUS42 TaxID=2908926 RepID=UPI001FF3EBDF|nr:branched-chain amino acid ABC transporter permease [Bradyrhizobium sp. PRIMUS42]MCJ9729649.1 branched-chain amino acid ABC transporter permease [Bradyrhizobium sp. PRIMUS42]